MQTERSNLDDAREILQELGLPNINELSPILNENTGGKQNRAAIAYRRKILACIRENRPQPQRRQNEEVFIGAIERRKHLIP